MAQHTSGGAVRRYKIQPSPVAVSRRELLMAPYEGDTATWALEDYLAPVEPAEWNEGGPVIGAAEMPKWLDLEARRKWAERRELHRKGEDIGPKGGVMDWEVAEYLGVG